MLKKDVEIGKVYWTKIGDERCQVEVTGTGSDYWGGNKTKFSVRRVGENKDLPKMRSPSALHMTKFGE